MIVVMDPHGTSTHLGHVVSLLDAMHAGYQIIDTGARTVVEIVDSNSGIDRGRLEQAPMVERVGTSGDPVLAAARGPDGLTREIPLGAHATIGGKKLAIIAGPCSVESKDGLLRTAHAAKEAGAVALRGGAFKPRTSPYAFQGHGEPGLEWLARAREETGLAVVTEVMRCEHVELVASYADVLQVGSRNMHNSQLLTAVGGQNKPVLLKRGWSATLQEFLLAAEYIMASGNPNVILCERGIRTFEKYTRNTLALAVVPEIKLRSTLPIIVDPSHGTGKADLVSPMSNASVACGADGLIIEVHQTPDRAWTDGFQSIDHGQFQSLMTGLKPFAQAAGRDI